MKLKPVTALRTYIPKPGDKGLDGKRNLSPAKGEVFFSLTSPFYRTRLTIVILSVIWACGPPIGMKITPSTLY